MSTVTFDLNGQLRRIVIRDLSVTPTAVAHRKAVEDTEIGAPLQGKLSAVLVQAGDKVKKDQPLFVIEAMKMETTITAPFKGKIRTIHLEDGALVEQNDLIVEFK